MQTLNHRSLGFVRDTADSLLFMNADSEVL